MNRIKDIRYRMEIAAADCANTPEGVRKFAKRELAYRASKDLENLMEFSASVDPGRGVTIVEGRLKVIGPDPQLTIEKAIPDNMQKRRSSMVSFDICGGNPGALQFLMDAYRVDMFKAEAAFQRMQDNNITGTKLYMLWNDCCGRDTKLAVQIAHAAPIDKIVEHINYEGGRGFPFTEEELAAIC